MKTMLQKIASTRECSSATTSAELSLVAIVNKLPESWMLLDHVVVVGISFDLAIDINVQGVPNYPWWQL